MHSKVFLKNCYLILDNELLSFFIKLNTTNILHNLITCECTPKQWVTETVTGHAYLYRIQIGPQLW